VPLDGSIIHVHRSRFAVAGRSLQAFLAAAAATAADEEEEANIRPTDTTTLVGAYKRRCSVII